MNYLIDTTFSKSILDLNSKEFLLLFETADIFVCAAGFETRGEHVAMSALVTKNPIIIAFRNGAAQNEKTLKRLVDKFECISGFDVCELDFLQPEKFEDNFAHTLSNVSHIQSGNIVLDVSALPNFAICIAIIKIRQAFPTCRLLLLHTEAEEYFPKIRDFPRIKRAMASHPVGVLPEYLSERAVNMFFPSMFTGVALGHNDTCLIVFAGYEPHRTNCVIEALNPSKLVMVYGEPSRNDLKWRLELAQVMHSGIDDRLLKTGEITSTAEISDNLELIIEYYDHLYDDHVVSVCPINSKMQAVAASLAWEMYPDIQLNFPLPAQYLPTRFSLGARNTFIIDLGISPAGRQFLR